MAKEYARARSRVVYFTCVIFTLPITLLYLPQTMMAILSWAQAISSNAAIIIGLCVLLLTFGYCLLEFYPAYLLGFALPHKYGTSPASTIMWLRKHLISVASRMGLLLVIGEVFYLLAPTTGDLWWLLIAISWILTYIVLPLSTPSRKFGWDTLTLIKDPILLGRLTILCERAGVRKLELWVLPVSKWTNSAQGWLLGIGPKSRIVVTDTMLERFGYDELEAILAHEIAHYIQRFLWKMLISSASGTIIATGTFYLLIAFSITIQQLGGAASLLTLPYFLMSFSIVQLLRVFIWNAQSRKDEAAADTYAMKLTNNPDAFKSAMIKLADQNLSEISPAKAANLGTHPRMSERINAAERMAGKTVSQVYRSTNGPLMYQPRQVRRIKVIDLTANED